MRDGLFWLREVIVRPWNWNKVRVTLLSLRSRLFSRARSMNRLIKALRQAMLVKLQVEVQVPVPYTFHRS